MRLQKHLAHAGVASRRASEELVFAGRVRVNGETVTDPARDVTGADDVRVDGRPATVSEDHLTLMLHKPAGVFSTAKDTHGRRTVLDLVASGGRRLYPVGRLDAETTGLILVTDDGELAHAVTHPSHEVPRTYVAVVDGGTVGEAALGRLRNGVRLEDGRTAPADVQQTRAGELVITIHEGRNRQVRRMCQAVGHRVRSLSRERLGPLELGDIREGSSRPLRRDELRALREAAGLRA